MEEVAEISEKGNLKYNFYGASSRRLIALNILTPVSVFFSIQKLLIRISGTIMCRKRVLKAYKIHDDSMKS